MKILSVWKKDIKEILKSTYMTIAIIAIILVPLVYGGLYLAAFWDPYGSTDALPVVVVNQDLGFVDKDGNNLSYGKDIVRSLKYNEDLKWVFEDDFEKARDGLVNEGYYAMFVIPEDFSRTLGQIRDGKLVKAKIEYIANEKKNYIVSLINSKASTAIENSISKSMSGVFTSIVFEELDYLKDRINTGAEAVYLLEDGVSKLNATALKLDESIGKLSEGTDILEDKLYDLSDGVSTLNDAIVSTNEKIPEFVDASEKIYKGSQVFNEKIEEAYDGASSLKDALYSYHNSFEDLQEATNSLSDASGKIEKNLDSLGDKSKDVRIAVEAITGGLDDLLEGLKKASGGSSELAGKYKDIEDGFFMLANLQINETKENLLILKGFASAELSADVDLAIASLDKLNSFDYYEFDKKQYFSDPQKELEKAYLEIDSLLNDFKLKMINVNRDLSQLLTTLKSNKSSLEYMLSTTNNKQEIIYYQTSLISLNQTIEKLEKGLNPNAMSVSLSKLRDLSYAKASVQAYGVSSNSLASGLNKNALVGLDKITSGSHELKNSMPKFESSVKLLGTYSSYLNKNIEKLDNKVPDLEQAIALIDDNSQKLSSGLLKLGAASDKILEGTKEFNGKLPDLQMGLGLIGEGNSKIKDGSLKLYSASESLNEGLSILNEKMPDLVDGVNAIYDGSSNLAKQLDIGSDKLAESIVVDANSMSAYISKPIEIQSDAIYSVENYGTGFAPYFIALALWVGALTMFFIIPDKREESSSTKEYIFGKYLTYGSVGIIQAIILSLVIIMIGLRPDNYFLYFAFNIILSLVFIAIMQCLIYLFADGGRLAATVFLLLQLTSCGGTFSVELLPKFFRDLSPFMPFTYAINGLREIISGVNPSVLAKSLIVLVLIQVFSLVILYFGMDYKDKYKGKKSNKMNKSNNSKDDLTLIAE